MAPRAAALDAELIAEHTIEATSGRVAATLSHRDELWDRCYGELMANTHARLAQEIARFGGHYAHVLDESIDARHDEATGEAWLHGRFSYMLYRRPSQSRQDARGAVPMARIVAESLEGTAGPSG